MAPLPEMYPCVNQLCLRKSAEQGGLCGACNQARTGYAHPIKPGPGGPQTLRKKQMQK